VEPIRNDGEVWQGGKKMIKHLIRSLVYKRDRRQIAVEIVPGKRPTINGVPIEPVYFATICNTPTEYEAVKKTEISFLRSFRRNWEEDRQRRKAEEKQQKEKEEL